MGTWAGFLDWKVVRCLAVWSCTQCKGVNLQLYRPIPEYLSSGESDNHMYGATEPRIYLSNWKYSESAVKLKKPQTPKNVFSDFCQNTEGFLWSQPHALECFHTHIMIWSKTRSISVWVAMKRRHSNVRQKILVIQLVSVHHKEEIY